MQDMHCEGSFEQVMNANRKVIMPNVELTCVTTDKFKASYFSVYLLQQLDRENASKNALIPSVLRRGCARYPDMESIAAALDELYGTTVEPLVATAGEIQCIGFISGFVDDKYIPGEGSLLERAVGLVGELLLTPVTKGGHFREDYVDSEKEKLCEQIRSALNDKISYSLQRMKEIMFKDEDFGVNKLGSVHTAQEITPEMLTGHYKSILEGSEIQMFYCGSADPARVEAAVQDAFGILPRREDVDDTCTAIRVNCEEAGYHTEMLDVTQGKLALGFRLGDAMYSPDYAAITVFNALYGGGISSKLFLNVREKLSLCYYASSMIERHKGVMIVLSGIEFNKYEEALEEILVQLEAVKNGEITQEEFDGAVKYVVTTIKSKMDSAISIDSFNLSQAIEGLDYGLEEYATLVEKVTIDDVIKIAQSVCLDTVYFLRDKQEVSK